MEPSEKESTRGKSESPPPVLTDFRRVYQTVRRFRPIAGVLEDAFIVSLILNAGFYLADIMRPGFVSDSLDVQPFWWASVVLGVWLATGNGTTETGSFLARRAAWVIGFVALATFLVVLFSIRSIGIWAFVVAALAAVSVFLVPRIAERNA